MGSDVDVVEVLPESPLVEPVPEMIPVSVPESLLAITFPESLADVPLDMICPPSAVEDSVVAVLPSAGSPEGPGSDEEESVLAMVELEEVESVVEGVVEPVEIVPVSAPELLPEPAKYPPSY